MHDCQRIQVGPPLGVCHALRPYVGVRGSAFGVRRWHSGLGVALACGALGLGLAAAEPAPPGTCHALVVAGLPGTRVHARRFADWATRCQAWLTSRAGVPAHHVTVLGATAAGAAAPGSTPATADAVQSHLRRLAETLRPEDQFVLVWLGHGSLTDGTTTFLLPGADLTVAALAELLEPLRAGNQVLLLLTSASGDAVAALARRQRVVVAATSPTEAAEPVFAEFLLHGLESGQADGMGAPAAGAADGTVTLLEAFNWAALETPRWVRRVRKDGDDWIVSGREATRLFQALCEAPPGTPGSRHLSPKSSPDIPDPDVPLATPAKDAAGSAGVRLVGEHAVLEDAGTPSGTAPLQGGRFTPVAGTAPDEPGSRARRVVLGRAALLPEPR